MAIGSHLTLIGLHFLIYKTNGLYFPQGLFQVKLFLIYKIEIVTANFLSILAVSPEISQAEKILSAKS